MTSQGSDSKREIERERSRFSFFNRSDSDFRGPQIDLIQNPHNVVVIILLFITIFLLAGGVFNLAETPLLMDTSPQGMLIYIYPSMSNQFLIESLAAGFFFAVGAAGFFLMRYATRYAYDTGSATIVMFIGVALVVVGALCALIMIQAKLGRAF
ncbi:MAG: hypothetical protein ACXAEU_18210 [Candidatus Hodarchaeales archaeon]|jgi:hypothetical protein